MCRAPSYAEPAQLGHRQERPGADDSQTVHNPGVVPDARFDETGADITVVFEHDYDSWHARRNATVTALRSDKREAYSLVIHSLPPALRGEELADFLVSLSPVAQHLFVTSNRVNFYESFADDWPDFVGRVTA